MIQTKGKISFIPKDKSITTKKAVYKQAGVGLLSKLAIFIFVVSLGILGWTIVYKNLLTEEIDGLSVSLERARAAIDPSLVLEMESLSATLTLAEGLLDNHRYTSNLFDFFEEVAHNEVVFDDFSFSQGSRYSSGGGTAVSMSGTARSYIALAEQSKIFESSNKVINFIFSDFVLDDEGDVSFSLSISFVPSILLLNNQ